MLALCPKPRQLRLVFCPSRLALVPMLPHCCSCTHTSRSAMLRSVPHKRRWVLMATSCCSDTHRSAGAQQHWTAAAHSSRRLGRTASAFPSLLLSVGSPTPPPQQPSGRSPRHRLLVAYASAPRALHSSGRGSRGGGPLLHGGHHHEEEAMEAEEKATAQRTPEMEAKRGKEMTRMSVTAAACSRRHATSLPPPSLTVRCPAVLPCSARCWACCPTSA